MKNLNLETLIWCLDWKKSKINGQKFKEKKLLSKKIDIFWANL